MPKSYLEQEDGTVNNIASLIALPGGDAIVGAQGGLGGRGNGGGSGKKQQGFKRSKTGCLNCKFRKVKCDEMKPTCTACQRLGMPCGNYGATLSKAAYQAQKQDFLEQVRRKGLMTEGRPKRAKKARQTAEEVAQQEQMQMQMSLGMAPLEGMHHPEDVTGLNANFDQHQFSPDVTHDYYAQAQDDPSQQVVHGSHEDTNNLFEMNPRAATIQQLQQLQSATQNHEDLQNAQHALQSTNQVFDAPDPYDPRMPEAYVNDGGIELSQNEPYVPSMITIDNLLHQQQHAIRTEQMSAAEEAAVRARKEASLFQQQQRKLMQQDDDPNPE